MGTLGHEDNSILIVGQGLAGTLISFYLSQQNIPHKVVDNNHFKSATKIAAGLINPITGRGYVKSWMIEKLLEEARTCYSALSTLLSTDLITNMDILRHLKNPAQYNKWQSATSRPGYEPFTKHKVQNQFLDILSIPEKFGIITQSCRVGINTLIKKYRAHLDQDNLIINENFKYDALSIKPSSITYNGVQYKHVIFAEGFQVIDNPYFKFVPIEPTKGEVLTIKLPVTIENQILRDEIFIVPIDEDIYWTGGGYNKFETDDTPSEDWKQEWLSKLNEMLSVDFKIQSHIAAIRPCVKDRRPVVGQHPTYKNLWIFNGLGTKGTSLGPFWAKVLCSHILEGTPVDDVVNVKRFVK